MTPIDRAVNTYLSAHDLPRGTSLENKVTMRLHRWKMLDCTQLRVGRYTLDFAWPAVKVAVEADGPHHWRPDVAIKDVNRDSWLRARGWLIFRVDEASETLDDQLARVVEVIGLLETRL